MSDRRPTLYLTKIGSPDQYGPGRDVGLSHLARLLHEGAVSDGMTFWCGCLHRCQDQNDCALATRAALLVQQGWQVVLFGQEASEGVG